VRAGDSVAGWTGAESAMPIQRVFADFVLHRTSDWRIVTRAFSVSLAAAIFFVCPSGNARGQPTLPAANHVYDTVVVGGGVAGLTAAYYLRHKDVLILEKQDRLGGRVQTDAIGNTRVNWGTQYLPHQASPADKFLDDLGIQFVVHRPSQVKIGFVLNHEFYPDLTALPGGLLVAWGLISEVSRSHMELRKARQSRAQCLALDHISAQPVPNSMPPSIAEYLSAFIRSASSAPPERISQLWYDNLVLDLLSPIKLPVGGMDEVVKALAGHVLARTICNCEVFAVQDMGDCVTVTASMKERGTLTIRARACVVAVPAPQCRQIVRDLPTWKDKALAQVEYGAYIVVTLQFSHLHWKRGLGAIVQGAVFSSWIDANATQGDWTAPSVQHPAVMTFFIPTMTNSAIWSASDESVINLVQKEMEATFPGINSSILDARLRRHTYGEPIAAPGYFDRMFQLKEPLPRIHFAGDYTDEPWLGGAIMSGMRCASELGAETPWAPPYRSRKTSGITRCRKGERAVGASASRA